MMSVDAALREGEHFYNTGDMSAYLDKIGRFRTLMSDLVAQGSIEAAMSVESAWYNRLVKKIEDEKHYRWCFEEHPASFWRAGLRVRQPLNYPADKNVVVFVAPTGTLLGHTEVMLRVLADLKHQGANVVPYFITFGGMTQPLAERLNAIGVGWAAPKKPPPIPMIADWLRQVVEHVRASTVVWLSVPCLVSYLFGYGIGQKQVLWSLKFKCYELPDEIIHIGYPHREYDVSEPDYMRHWRPYMPPFGYDTQPPNEQHADQIKQLRQRFGSGIILGSLAREEILNQQEYVDAVVRILRAVPEAQFIYTGRTAPVMMASALEKHGLSARSHFVGWVDTAIFGALLSVFLEPFPFGCGVTIAQALGCGTRAISLWTPSVFASVYFKNAADAKSVTGSWSVAATVDEYVAMAVEAARDSLQNKGTPVDLHLLEKGRALEFLEKIDMKI